MSKGIYKYTDLKTGDIVYVGKDSHIDENKRYNDHLTPSRYDEQPFNRILQNNPKRYEYGVIWETEYCTTLKLNKMEILFGKIYNPKFNFGKYGKGGVNSHSEKTKQKMSDVKSGKNNPMWNKHHTEETKQKMSENHAKYWKDKTHSDETKILMSKYRNSTGYLNVYKKKSKTCKQGFTWVYQYYEDGKRKSITSTNIKKLEKKIKAKGLEWREL